MKSNSSKAGLVCGLLLAACGSSSSGTADAKLSVVDAASAVDAAVVIVDAPRPADAGIAIVDAASAVDTAVASVDAQAAPDATPTPVRSIKLFSSSFTGQFNGEVLPNFGGRAGGDALCQSIASTPAYALTCPGGVHAFLSVDATDQLKDMPTNYGVPTDEPLVDALSGSPVATKWDAMFGFTPESGMLEGTLGSTGVMWDGAYWFSGSDTTGSFAGDDATCLNWTNDSVVGEIWPSMGYSSMPNYQWIEESVGYPDYQHPDESGPDGECDEGHVLVCLCY